MSDGVVIRHASWIGGRGAGFRVYCVQVGYEYR